MEAETVESLAQKGLTGQNARKLPEATPAFQQVVKDAIAVQDNAEAMLFLMDQERDAVQPGQESQDRNQQRARRRSRSIDRTNSVMDEARLNLQNAEQQVGAQVSDPIGDGRRRSVDMTEEVRQQEDQQVQEEQS